MSPLKCPPELGEAKVRSHELYSISEVGNRDRVHVCISRKRNQNLILYPLRWEVAVQSRSLNSFAVTLLPVIQINTHKHSSRVTDLSIQILRIRSILKAFLLTDVFLWPKVT